MTEHITATDAARAAIEQLEQAHGVMFFQRDPDQHGDGPTVAMATGVQSATDIVLLSEACADEGTDGPSFMHVR